MRNEIATTVLIVLVAASSLIHSLTNGLTFPTSFESSTQLFQAVDVYMDVNPDEEALLDVITTYGVMESWDVSKITDFSNLFSRQRNSNVVNLRADLSLWDVSNAQNFSSIFRGARFVDFDVSSWDVSNALDFSRMFDSASSFQGRGLAGWNVSSGLDFSEMFRGATSFGTNSDTNNLCAWGALVSSTAVTDMMFSETQCPAEQQRDDLDVEPSLRDAVAGGTSFCQPCAAQAETVDQVNGSAQSNEDKTADDKRPNILLIMTDQQRFDTIRFVQDELSHYDGAFKIDTPNLDRLLQEGAYFRNAYCQCAVCAPARTTLRTGCTIERTGMQHNDLADNYAYGELFLERVESLESLDHILVEKYGYISEYYGKWHMPDLLYHSKSNTSEPIVQFNDFDFLTDKFGFIGDDSSHKVRRYLKQYEEIGIISREQKSVNATAVLRGKMPQMSRGKPQIDTYTRYPYIPVQLDTRYDSPVGTDLKDGSFESYEQSQPNLMGIFSLSEEESPTHFTGDIAIRALDRLKAQPEPWFLTVSFHHPHPPFIAPYGTYLDKYWSNRELLHVSESLNDSMDDSAYSVITDQLPGYGDPAKIQEWTAIYYALIEEVDAKIGEILNALDSATKDTLIIFTSDHGEMLGAHKRRAKDSFYEEASRVPLIMKFPGQIEESVEVDEVVSHLDLFATILDYAGASKDDRSDGKSLRSFIEGTEYSKDYDENVVFAEWDYRTPMSPGSNQLDRQIDNRPSFLVRKGNYKLMMQKLASSNEMDMMFNLEDDPFEMNNLLGKRAMSADTDVIVKAEHMRCLLLDWMERLDGDKGYYSDPAANYGDSEGDLNEIRNRQKWKEIDFWKSREVLKFGRLGRGGDGSFVLHEHLFFGTRKNENVSVQLVGISGPDADLFSVDKSSIEFGHRDCKSIRISLRSEHDFPDGSQVEAIITFEVERSTGNGSSNAQSIKSNHTVQLLLNTEVYGEPKKEGEALGQNDAGMGQNDVDMSGSSNSVPPSSDGSSESPPVASQASDETKWLGYHALILSIALSLIA
ncbi:sulfatase [Nitzschia inconspicua]|uniref:Sulfatase n=1 Tax=Nitzschia inconspicua TaxID=303405 RepID=A0A9K3L3D3_9STRA|nr:sulfatase [Nitzschia inconspicua]